MEISIEEVKKLAKLSRLEFTDEEILKFREEFAKTLEYVNAINKVDVSKVDLFEDTLQADTELRVDEVKQSLPVEDITLNAPEQKDGAFLVPITVTED